MVNEKPVNSAKYLKTFLNLTERLAMKIHKFYDPKYNPEFPFVIEIINESDGFDEVLECLWFATEEEQIEEFNEWLKDFEPYTEH